MKTTRALFFGGLILTIAILDVFEVLPSGSAIAAVLFVPALAVANRGQSCRLRRS